MTDPRKGPVIIEMDADGPSPAEAPPVPETLPGDLPEGQAMQAAAAIAARRPSVLRRWFWRLLFALVVFFASVWAWETVTALLDRNPTLGLIATALLAVFGLVTLAIVIRELAALARLSRLDKVQHRAVEARAGGDLAEARKVAGAVADLYRGRADMRWAMDKLDLRRDDIFEPADLLDHAERTLLVPLDARARGEVEAAARSVATVTAFVPIALADMIAALGANIRMIRRIAEIYGGRGGTLGSLRLTRAVFTHLVATGAVAVGDDLIGSVGGGHLLSRLSRRFGEGVVNGALTARVGIAAMEVCRPLPFAAVKRPSVSGTVSRALGGLLPKGKD